MTQSKIQVTVGAVSFSGEGDPVWLTEQLDKVLKAAPELAEPQNSQGLGSKGGAGATETGFATPLASYIREKGGEQNQVSRFLIAADWMRRRGESKLTAGAVNKALKDNQQKRLANAADSLNKNVSKGFCEKADGGFYITPDGLKELGYPQ